MRIYATERYYEKLICEADNPNLKKGIEGEKQVFHWLKTLSISKYKGFGIPNFKFHYIDEKVECDFLIVTDNSIIILEIKNWTKPMIFDNLGQVYTGDDDTRNNVFAQVNRQKELLQEKLRTELKFEVNIETCVLFSNPQLHKFENTKDIIDYSSVVLKIKEIINKNSHILINLKDLHKFLIENNENTDFDSAIYYKDSNISLSSDDFLNNVKEETHSNENKSSKFIKYNLNKHKRYYFQVCKDTNKENGCSVYIPNNISSKYYKVDTRFFAVLYNIFIRGKQYFIPANLQMEFNYETIKFEIHYFILCSLLFIKNGFFSLQNNTIILPLTCDKQVMFASKKVFEYYIEIFEKISDVTKYEIEYSDQYEVVINEIRKDIKTEKFIYIETEIETENASKNNNKTKIEFEKSIWRDKTIKYSFTNHEKYLVQIVEMLFNFSSFKPGQLECICNAFENENSQVIMLPTGQGKSTIFYLLLLLQPKMGIIIYPSKVLIKDQIDILSYKFGINNINDFNTTHNFDSSHIQIMLPDNILEKQVLEYFINANKKISISYLILDEVHCLSKYSHDFRPEYFLLHDKLNYYLDKTIVKGFTATATWEVLEDLKEQFHMRNEDIFSPNLLRKDIEYIVKEVKTEDHIDIMIKDIDYIRKKFNDDKILVFTNNREEFDYIKNNINIDDVSYIVDENDYDKIDDFRIYGKDVLVSTNDYGIGIDIPEINTIIHYTQPLSIADFSQHVGRGGRADYSCTSIVYYKENDYNINQKFKNVEKAIALVYQELKQNIDKGYNWASVRVDKIEEIDYKFVFFSFFQLGIISEWWKEDSNTFGIGINHNFQLNFNLIKRHVFEKMKNERTLLQRIKNTTNLINLVIEYFNWYKEWDLLFKKNSYDLMKKLLLKINKENLKNSRIQRLISESTYYNNLEIVNIEEIKNMSYIKIVEFINNNIKQLSSYKKYLNSTNLNIRFLSLLIDMIECVNQDSIVFKLKTIIENLQEVEKVLLVCALFESRNLHMYDQVLEYIYLNLYKNLKTNQKMQIFMKAQNQNMKENYKYLFFFSLIHDKLLEEDNGE